MNEQNASQYIQKRMTSKKKALLIALGVALALFLVVGALIAILEAVSDDTPKRDGEVETIDPWLLEETKPEGFDIMEYEDYLALDRTVYRYDKYTGVTVSVSPEEYGDFGEEFELVCLVLKAINEGDVDAYNAFMGDGELEKSWFSQQQIYGIEISLYSTQSMTDKEGASYSEHVFEVRYKIHENNGSYRNTVDSDQTRPQYFVLNDSTGQLLVMDILEKNYKK